MADHGHGSRVRLELCSRARSSVKQQRNTIVHISLVNLEDLTLHRTGLAGIPLLAAFRRRPEAYTFPSMIYMLWSFPQGVFRSPESRERRPGTAAGHRGLTAGGV